MSAGALSVPPPSVPGMRLLHTSDWHIGRTFHGHDLLADQEFVLSALADLVAEHRVDVVLIAGDIYARAVPSAEAVQVASRILNRIRSSGAQIVASSGNHDSAPRLGAFPDFLAAGGLHLRTAVADVGRPVVLDDADGAVALYAIPYLEPELAKTSLGVPGRPGHQAVLSAAMDLVRSDLAGRPVGTRSVVLAHAFVVGAVAGGSERSIAVGGVESVAAEVFTGVDYVALGHLHGAQVLRRRIRYSGSPLPYSFGEAHQRKGAWLIDLQPDGSVLDRWLDLPVLRPLAVLTGELAELMAGASDYTEHYVSVVLTDPVRPVEPMRRLRERFTHALTVCWRPLADQPAARRRAPEAALRTDEEIVTTFLLECRGSAATPSEQALLDAALTAQRVLEATG